VLTATSAYFGEIASDADYIGFLLVFVLRASGSFVIVGPFHGMGVPVIWVMRVAAVWQGSLFAVH
jgi:hypothetical protein